MGATGLVSWGYVRQRLGQAVVADDGTAVLGSDPVRANHRWRLLQISVTSDSGTEGPCLLYLGDGDANPADLDSASATGTGDQWHGNAFVLAGEVILLAWAGLTPGATVRARCLYEDLEEVATRPGGRNADPTIATYGL